MVQADDLATGISQTVIAMITSKMSRAGHPSRVTLLLSSDEGRRSGLRCDSVILTDNLATAVDGLIEKVIGKCGSMDAVDAALRHTLAL